MRKVAFLFLLIPLCTQWSTPGQQPGGLKYTVQGAEKPQPPQPLTNESILGLIKIGFSDETIISMVEYQPGNYSLTAANVIALKKAGVSEKVIRAMLSKSASGQAAAAATGGGAAVNAGKPGSGSSFSPEIGVPTEPGLYAQLSDGALRHIAGRPTSFVRTGSLLASSLTAGIHARRMNTQIAGERAYVTVGRTPTFYYRVAKNAPDQVVPGTLSLILTQMSVMPGRRQFELDASGMLRRSEGISVRHQSNFDAQEIEPGLYELRPDELKSGQYAFFLYVAGPDENREPRASTAGRKAGGEALRGFLYDFQVE